MQTITYMTSLFTFYLKGEIKSEQNFISFKTPNTILGLIPLGAKTEKMAINQIASTTSNSRVQLKPLILGAFCALAGFSGLGSGEIGAVIVLLLLAANFLIDAFEYNLVVTTTAGQQKLINFLIFDKKKADEAAYQINEMISNRLDDTNNRQQTDRIVDAINNK